MPISFDCKKCGLSINVGGKKAGKKIKCPNCGRISIVPEGTDEIKLISEKSDKIRFCCENCGQKIKVPKIYSGKKGKCPKCQNMVIVPGHKQDNSDLAIPNIPDTTNTELRPDWLKIIYRNRFIMRENPSMYFRDNLLKKDLFDYESKNLLIQMGPRPGLYKWYKYFMRFLQIIPSMYQPYHYTIDIKRKLDEQFSFFTLRTGIKEIFFPRGTFFEVSTPERIYGWVVWRSNFNLLALGKIYGYMFDSNKHKLLKIEVKNSENEKKFDTCYYGNGKILMKIEPFSSDPKNNDFIISFTDLAPTNEIERTLLLLIALMHKFHI
ncbi:MAG: hypothetical protein JXB49_36730 [Bacteroidales bacterium]|nr:hypothetical protein [Bacteroidales bacterium]